MNGTRDCHNEWSKSDIKGQISYDTSSMQYLKKVYKWVYLQNRNKITDVENKFIVTKGERGGINWVIGIDIYTLLYLKQVTNKDLL